MNIKFDDLDWMEVMEVVGVVEVMEVMEVVLHSLLHFSLNQKRSVD